MSFLALTTDTASAKPKEAQPNADHLVPIGESILPGYAKLLDRKLYVSSTDRIRIVVLPSVASIGETAVSFDLDRKDSNKAVLICTHAEANLWAEAFHLDVNLRHEPNVRVHRTDVSFPKSLALGLSEILQDMIRQSHEPQSTDRIILHGTHILFFARGSGQAQWARLAPESAGKNSDALRTIAELLVKYCKNPPADRASLAAQIQGQVAKLIQYRTAEKRM